MDEVAARIGRVSGFLRNFSREGVPAHAQQRVHAAVEVVAGKRRGLRARVTDVDERPGDGRALVETGTEGRSDRQVGDEKLIEELRGAKGRIIEVSAEADAVAGRQAGRGQVGETGAPRELQVFLVERRDDEELSAEAAKVEGI